MAIAFGENVIILPERVSSNYKLILPDTKPNTGKILSIGEDVTGAKVGYNCQFFPGAARELPGENVVVVPESEILFLI